MVLTIEEFSDRPFFKVTQYILRDIPPEIQVHEVVDVFNSDKVLVPGYRPISYRESYFPRGLNSYNHPMPEYLWNLYTKQSLNSDNHRRHREHWLWSVFSRLAFGDIYDQMDVLRFRPTLKLTWQGWKTRMLFDNSVAAELIFMKSFPKLILPSSSSSS